MTNSNARKSAKEKMMDNKKILMYSAVFFGIFTLLSFIPGLDRLGFLLQALCFIGFMIEIINMAENSDSSETPFSFFNHTIQNFGKIFCSGLWLVLKAFIGYILIGIGYGLIIGSGGLLFYSIFSSSSNIGSIGGTLIIGFLLTIIGFITVIVIEFSYYTISFDLAHSDGKDIRAKEIVEQAKNNSKGHIWQLFCNTCYWGVMIFLETLLLGIIVFLLGVFNNVIVENIIIAIISCINMPKWILSTNELYLSFVGTPNDLGMDYYRDIPTIEQ